MYHQIMIVGALGKDAELRYTPEGQAMASMSVAASEGFKDEKRTTWFRVIYWRSPEKLTPFLKKGTKVLIVGKLVATKEGNPRIWSKQDKTAGASFEVTASEIRLLSSKAEAEECAADLSRSEPETEIP